MNLNCVATFLLLLLSTFGANAFEVTRGSAARDVPTDAPPPVVSVDDFSKPMIISRCHKITNVVESTLLLGPLSEPFVKDGQTYKWRIGQDSASTCWYRQNIGDDRHLITLHFVALDITIKFEATALLSERSSGRHSHARYVVPGPWNRGQWFFLVDEKSNRGVYVEYWSRGAKVNSRWSDLEIGPDDIDIRISRIEIGTLSMACTLEKGRSPG